MTKTADTAFDPNALRSKYRQERDKRLRQDGNDQYVEVKDQFAHYVDDPYVDAPLTRAPLTDEVDVVVVGGGFGGLLAGARLRQAGVESIRLIEKGADFGGTWYWNRYPGAACDVESYIYLPLLEETGYMPVEKYTRAREILEHSRRIARHFNLYTNACLQTEVTETRWDEETGHWVIHTNRGDRMRARFLVMSNGPLHRPKLPGIPGIETFKGHSFHTSRWDYDYTGGGPDGGLDKLSGKRVGIIGTGATAVQCVPHLAKGAQHLYVFQRTPSSIDVRNNQPTDWQWAQSLEPGWHKKRMENFNILVSGGYQAEDLVNDGWTDIIRNLLFLAEQDAGAGLTPEKLAEIAELADFTKMEQIRGRVAALVADPTVAEALKPWYRQFCKRPCFHDDYLQAFNRPNVTLVDTEGRGVQKVTEHAVVANGKTYDLDCLIYATGFEVGTSYTRRSGYDVFGRGGQSLSSAWEDGVRSLHGIFVHGFPNLFVMGGAQSGLTVNYPHLLDEQSSHIGYVLQEARKRQWRAVEVTEEAEAAWVQKVLDKALLRTQFFEECTPGYYNNEGKVADRNGQSMFYGGGSVEYFAILNAWRQAGDLPGIQPRRDFSR